mmetsp:Transcript_43214/g.101632  ORF Transcript_43214/g.101632 Transcript_43214/m.101632 type:complete len:355 (-) Transcript_43214:41-1105(-)
MTCTVLTGSFSHPSCDVQVITQQMQRLRHTCHLALVGSTLTYAACRCWKWYCSQKAAVLGPPSTACLLGVISVAPEKTSSGSSGNGNSCCTSIRGGLSDPAPLYMFQREDDESSSGRHLTFTELFENGCGEVLVHVLCNFDLQELEPLRRVQRRLSTRLNPRRLLPTLACMPAQHWLDVAPLADLLTTTVTSAPVTKQEIIKAAFADALRAGGALDAVLVGPLSGGRTPLQVAVQRQLPDVVRTLVGPLGAPPDVGDMASGWSPLMFAISCGNRSIAEILIAHGASINFVSRPHGYTPLMAALVSGSEPLVEWLLSKGADPWTDIKVLRGSLVAHFGKESPAVKRFLDGKRRSF